MATRGDANRWIREVIASRAKIALIVNIARVRIDDVPRDTSALHAAIRIERGVKRARQLAVRPRHLLHAGVVAVRRRDHLVVRRLSTEQEPPAADARYGRGSCVVDAVSLRSIGSGRTPRSLLL